MYYAPEVDTDEYFTFFLHQSSDLHQGLLLHCFSTGTAENIGAKPPNIGVIVGAVVGSVVVIFSIILLSIGLRKRKR